MLVGAWIASCSRWYAAAMRRSSGVSSWIGVGATGCVLHGVRLPHDDSLLGKSVAGLARLRIEPIRLAGLRISAARGS